MITTCKLCGSDNLQKVYSNTFFKRPVDVVSCGDCGLVFVDIIDEAFIDAFYEDQYQIHERYAPDSSLKKRLLHFVSRTLINAYEERRLRMLQKYFKSSGNRFLDVGCTEGDFLNKVRQFGEVFGTELSNSLATTARQNGITILGGKISDVPAGQKFNFISYFHVFEHLVDPIGELTTIGQYLTDDGYLVCEQPYTKSIDTLTSQTKAFYFNDAHLNHFNERSFSKLAELANFEVVDLKVIEFKKTLARRLYDGANPHYLHPSFSILNQYQPSLAQKMFSMFALAEILGCYLLGGNPFTVHTPPFKRNFKPDLTMELFVVLRKKGAT